MRTRRALVIVHRYTAFALGLWFVLLGMTGAILVYRDALDRWLNPALLTVPRPADISIPSVFHAAQRAFPQAHVERIRAPRQPDEAFRVLLRLEGLRRVGSPRLEALFGGAEVQLLGTRDPDTRSLDAPHLLQTIYDLHHRVLLGNTGKDAVGVAGILLVTTTSIGLVLGLPRADRRSLRRAFALKTRAGAKRIVYDLHRAAGMTGAALLLLAGATGALMAYPEYARDLVGLASPVRPLPQVPWRPGAGAVAEAWPAVERLVARTHAAYPRHRITEVHFPARPTAPVLVYLLEPGDVHRLGDTLVLFHALGGDVLVERSGATRTRGEGFLHWLFPLHSGTALGAPGRWLAVAAGVLPLWLLASGLAVWWLKQRGPGRRAPARPAIARG